MIDHVHYSLLTLSLKFFFLFSFFKTISKALLHLHNDISVRNCSLILTILFLVLIDL